MLKTCKMAAGGLWSTVSPKVPGKVLVYFVESTVKKQSLRWKYCRNILAIVLFNLTVNFASVKFNSVNLSLQLFYKINHKEIKNRKLSKNKRKYVEIT